ncbi:hypothetical protein Pyn_10850 [Prunus yedoensis var. nudiflora]|uniref:Secreted protein n=1 Tax=Prunus yedoensis var. nudiflora TaxID=2094558 RepID=A0A314UQW7_PRUYE|nr:hypothetical protein Pyn_10850 [Prunus yedoensis var. nudiflora]
MSSLSLTAHTSLSHFCCILFSIPLSVSHEPVFGDRAASSQQRPLSHIPNGYIQVSSVPGGGKSPPI